MNARSNLILTKKNILFLFAIIIPALSFYANAQEVGCLNVCPEDTEKQISVTGEISGIVNGIVCIDNLTGDNFVIQNGDILSTLPQALYTCYTVAVSNATGEGFNIASATYSIGNVQGELDLALLASEESEECANVSSEPTIIDINNSYCSPTDKICTLDLCLCEEDSPTDFVISYTPSGDSGEEVFVLVNESGILVSVSSNTTISAVGLAKGNYQIYAIIYDPAKAGNLVSLLNTGNALADVQAELSNTACGTISTGVEATINADVCNCDEPEPPETGDCVSEICPCNGEVNEIKLSTSGYTGGENQQWYVVVSGGSIVTSQQAVMDGSVSFTNLPDGIHQIYAVNYDPTVNETLADVLADGNLWASVADGINNGTYCADFVGPKNITINAEECGCELPPASCNDTGIENDAGIMPNPQGLDFCYGMVANTSTTGAVINAGSSLTYILHSGAGSDLGQTVDYNNTGIFANNGVYPTGLELYVCAVVSPGVGVFPDLDSDCTDISDNCTPVQFLSQIDIDTEVVCGGNGNYTVLFELSGGLPAAESGNLYSVNGDYTGLVAPNTTTNISSLSAGSFYTLKVSDNAGCTATVNSEKILCEKLPIELISYSGAAQTQGNVLKWITATEIENDYFTLKRSVDGVNFKTISIQKGAGTNNSTQQYTYMDREAPGGLSYYQLLQTDFDGTNYEVGIVSLLRGETSLGIHSLLPIPVLSLLELTYTSNEESQIELHIYNAIGKKLGMRTVAANKGLNQVKVDVSTYPSGMYFLTLIQGEDILTEKFIKD